MGWRSWSILEALHRNGSGRLQSSDLPYKRRPGTEDYIGHVVPEALRAQWRLDTRGDRAVLADIAAEGQGIDLFHYDSDKSWHGREFSVRCVGHLIAPGAPMIFDDIQDNFHFRDCVEATGAEYHVFPSKTHYVGLTFAQG